MEKRKILCCIMILSLAFIACTRDEEPPVLPDIPDTENPDAENSVNTLPTGWSKVDLGTNKLFADVFFVGDTGFAFSGPDLYRSVNGGSDWQKQKSVSRQFKNLGMGSNKNAVVLAHGTYNVFITKNAGVEFDSVAINDDLLADVFFINADIAYIVGRKFWKTTDGGYTWQKLSDLNHQKYAVYSSLYFVNEQHGYLNLSTGIYSTKDGGVNWQKLNTGSIKTDDGAGAVFFSDTAHGFISTYHEAGKYIQSTSSIERNISLNLNYHDIHFTSQDTGYITDGHSILKTTNGGASWSKELSGEDLISEIHFTDANHGWASSMGCIYKYIKP